VPGDKKILHRLFLIFLNNKTPRTNIIPAGTGFPRGRNITLCQNEYLTVMGNQKTAYQTCKAKFNVFQAERMIPDYFKKHVTAGPNCCLICLGSFRKTIRGEWYGKK